MLIYLSMIESEADKSLFEQLYIRYKGLMYHIAYRILQNREDAEDAIAKLNPRYREVILLHYAYGYKTSELADMLDMKQDSVRRLLWRAKEALRKNLEEGGIPV